MCWKENGKKENKISLTTWCVLDVCFFVCFSFSNAEEKLPPPHPLPLQKRRREFAGWSISSGRLSYLSRTETFLSLHVDDWVYI